MSSDLLLWLSSHFKKKPPSMPHRTADPAASCCAPALVALTAGLWRAALRAASCTFGRGVPASCCAAGGATPDASTQVGGGREGGTWLVHFEEVAAARNNYPLPCAVVPLLQWRGTPSTPTSLPPPLTMVQCAPGWHRRQQWEDDSSSGMNISLVPPNVCTKPKTSPVAADYIQIKLQCKCI